MKYHRRVITIRAEDSPNVRLALAQRAAGKVPTGKVLVPGVLTWEQYLHHRATWDKMRQCIGLDAKFYLGAELLAAQSHLIRYRRKKLDRCVQRNLGVIVECVYHRTERNAERARLSVVFQLGSFQTIAHA